MEFEGAEAFGEVEEGGDGGGGETAVFDVEVFDGGGVPRESPGGIFVFGGLHGFICGDDGHAGEFEASHGA